MLGSKQARRWLAGLALVTVAAGGTAVLVLQRPAKAAVQYYQSTFKGVTRTLDGPAQVDIATGSFVYSVTAPAIEASISGEGTLATGPKGSFGQSSFDSGSWQGTAIILGKFNKDASRFKGKIVVSIPNQLGPAPNGFTYTTGTIVLEETIPD